MRSLKAPAVQQITELELMLQEEIIEPLPSPRFQSKLMRKLAKQA
jgi:hypothetical protein